MVIGVPLGLVVASNLTSGEDAPAASGDAGDATDGEAVPEGDQDPDTDAGAGDDPAPDPGPDPGPGDDGDDPGADAGPGEDPDGDSTPPPSAAPDRMRELDPLDLTRLDGLDAVYGRLLTDIDASELAMLGFQTGLSEAFGGDDSPAEVLERIGEVAETQRDELLEVRGRLAPAVTDPGADRVRELYLDHLDSWAEYLGAVADDPRLLLDQTERDYSVTINATADRFARGLEDALPEDIDGEVARFAEDVLDRGFRGFGYADV